MKKSMIIIVSFSVSFVFIASLMATPTFFREHKPRKKNGAEVVKSCSFCHNDTTGLKKMKGQNYKKIQKTPTCQGQGCHR